MSAVLVAPSASKSPTTRMRRSRCSRISAHGRFDAVERAHRHESVERQREFAGCRARRAPRRRAAAPDAGARSMISLPRAARRSMTRSMGSGLCLWRCAAPRLASQGCAATPEFPVRDARAMRKHRSLATRSSSTSVPGYQRRLRAARTSSRRAPASDSCGSPVMGGEFHDHVRRVSDRDRANCFGTPVRARRPSAAAERRRSTDRRRK